MAEQVYYSVFTKKGLELLTEAIRNGTKLGITSMAFGDGGGSLPVPNENFTSMVREVHRTQLNSLAPDPNNANWLRADAIIASATGGFNIRELGLYAGNILVAYSNYPPTYKPNPSDGTARIMSFRMILQIDNTANFDLVIDPDVVLATIQSVNDIKKELLLDNMSNNRGTTSLFDTQQDGYIDDLVKYTTTSNVDLRNKKIVIPNGDYKSSSDGWFINRSAPVSTETSGLTDFELTGQGSNTTKIISANVGAQMFFDYAKNFKMSGFTLDGGDSQRNGQLWMRHSEDAEFSDLMFKNGYTLSFTIDHCKNIQANDLKVDGQKVYLVGDGKSPLIVGDFSQQSKIIGGYTKAVSSDDHLYEGDLGDNDDSTDTKWAFHNFYGLMIDDKSNSNVCLWQEGERERGNMHGIGNNYVGNGFGRGVSEKSIGTDVACSFNKNQRAGVWVRGTQYVSIGNHFLDITNVQNLVIPIFAAIHSESADFLASVGNVFNGNERDYSQYSSGPFVAGNGYFSVADSFSSTLFQDPSSTNYPQHNAFIGSRFNENSKFVAAKNDTFNVFTGSQFVGFAGYFGRGNDLNLTNIHRFSQCSFNNKGSNIYALNASIYARIFIKDSNFTNYPSICDFSNFQGILTYEKCIFNSCTFSNDDLSKSRFIDCTFIDCTNSPSQYGVNFKCDSNERPSTIRTEIPFIAGGSYTFPSWTHEQRGVYDISVGGRSDNLPVYKGYAYKSSAASAATIVNTLESTAGAITASWAANGYITITATIAGTYSIKLG